MGEALPHGRNACHLQQPMLCSLKEFLELIEVQLPVATVDPRIDAQDRLPRDDIDTDVPKILFATCELYDEALFV